MLAFMNHIENNTENLKIKNEKIYIANNNQKETRATTVKSRQVKFKEKSLIEI